MCIRDRCNRWYSTEGCSPCLMLKNRSIRVVLTSLASLLLFLKIVNFRQINEVGENIGNGNRAELRSTAHLLVFRGISYPRSPGIFGRTGRFRAVLPQRFAATGGQTVSLVTNPLLFSTFPLDVTPLIVTSTAFLLNIVR